MKRTQRGSMGVGGGLVLLLLVSCATPAGSRPRFEYRQALMGVQARCLVHAASESEALAAAKAAFQRMEEIEARVSDWRADSELSTLTRREPGQWHVVGRDLFALLAAGRRLAAESEGAFDLTVGPLSAVWRQARKEGLAPTEAQIEGARSRVDWRGLELDIERRAVRFDRRGMRLDPGGLAKGYAADEGLRILRAHGLSEALVEVGGDLALGAPPPGTKGWRIARLDVEEALILSSCGVATSGDRELGLDEGGVRHSHVIDPRTGRATTHRREITVIAPSGMLADGLASALLVAPPEEWARILRGFPGSRALAVPATRRFGGL